MRHAWIAAALLALALPAAAQETPTLSFKPSERSWPIGRESKPSVIAGEAKRLHEMASSHRISTLLAMTLGSGSSAYCLPHTARHALFDVLDPAKDHLNLQSRPVVAR